MRKDAGGAIISVRRISEVDGACFCSECKDTYLPSMKRDVFPDEAQKQPDGEMPLVCERCFDQRLVAEGKTIIDLTPLILGIIRFRWLLLACLGIIVLMLVVC